MVKQGACGRIVAGGSPLPGRGGGKMAGETPVRRRRSKKAFDHGQKKLLTTVKNYGRDCGQRILCATVDGHTQTSFIII